MFGKFNQTFRLSGEYFKLTNLDLGGNFHLKRGFLSHPPLPAEIDSSLSESQRFCSVSYDTPKNKISWTDHLNHLEYSQYCQFGQFCSVSDKKPFESVLRNIPARISEGRPWGVFQYKLYCFNPQSRKADFFGQTLFLGLNSNCCVI